MQFLGIVFACCFIVVSSFDKPDSFNIRGERILYPTECCICDDYSPDPSLHCSTPGICEKHFTRCDYCETVRNYTGTTWKTTRKCSIESDCVTHWYQTVTELGCIDNNRGEPPAGTMCYSCCRTPSPLQPHYCTISPDTHFIQFNVTTLPPTASTLLTTMSTKATTLSPTTTTMSTTASTQSLGVNLSTTTSTHSLDVKLSTTASTQCLGPVCYNCNSQSSPGQCQSITQCQLGQVCTLFHDQTGYSSKCIDKQLCIAAKNLAGASKCWECCETSLCNDICSVSAATTTTTTPTTKTGTESPTPPTQSSLTVDGGWSDWGQWHGCDTPNCDGRRVRIRFCNSPVPSGGGANCPGAGFEEEWCNPTNCQTGGVSSVG